MVVVRSQTLRTSPTVYSYQGGAGDDGTFDIAFDDRPVRLRYISMDTYGLGGTAAIKCTPSGDTEFALLTVTQPGMAGSPGFLLGWDESVPAAVVGTATPMSAMRIQSHRQICLDLPAGSKVTLTLPTATSFHFLVMWDFLK